MQIVFSSFFIIVTLIGIVKALKKLTDEQKKQPIKIMFSLCGVVSLLLFILGITIFDNFVLSDIGIALLLLV